MRASSNRQGSRDPARGQWEILSQCVVVVVVVRLDSCLTAAATLRCCIDCSSVASSLFDYFYFIFILQGSRATQEP